MKKYIALLYTISALLFVGCSAATHTSKWEYRTLSGVTDDTVNQMAEQGWSVVGFSEYSPFDGTTRTSYLLKRPKQ
jgi:hypothetical protein